MLFSAPIGVVVGVFFALMLPAKLAGPIVNVVAALTAFIVAIWVAKRILSERKAYSDFRIALIEKEQPARLQGLESKQEPVSE